MKLDEFRSGSVKNKISTGLVLVVVLMCDEIESEIGFANFGVEAAMQRLGKHSHGAHFLH